MKRLLRLALAADFVALVTVLLGSWTRINGAGMTCPDWPLCHGQLFPSLMDGSIYEWTHRLLALAVAPLVVAVVVVGWRRRASSPFIAPTVVVIAALFLVQVLLGAETVRLENAPLSVVLHWGTAMALIAAFSALAVFAAASPAATASRDQSRVGANLRFTLATTATLAFITMCIGAYVSSSGAGLACLSIPGCAGNVVVYSSDQYVQMLHRSAAAATLLFAAAALALSWVASASRRVRVATGCGVALVCLQIVLGLLNVTLRLPETLREAHAINAAFLFLTFFVASVFATVDAGIVQPRRALSTGGAHQ